MRTDQVMLQRQRVRIRFRSQDQDYYMNVALGIADVLGGHGEYFHAAAQMRNGDSRSWRAGLTRQAEHSARRSREATAAGRPLEAAHWQLQGAYQRRMALTFTPPDDPTFVSQSERLTADLLDATKGLGVPLEPVEIPFRDGALPGFLLKIDDEPRPALMQFWGADGSKEDQFWHAGLSGWRHGYNVLMVDLPGIGLNPAHGMPFIPEMGEAISASIDELYRRVPNTTGVALWGYSGGGYFTAQAVAADPRVSAWIAGTPIFDAASVFRHEFATVLKVPNRFLGKLVKVAGLFNSSVDANLRRYAWQFGESTFTSAMDRMFEVSQPVDYRQITCPSLFLYSEGEGPELLRQMNVVADDLGRRGVRVDERIFTAADGAEAHCQFNNVRYTWRVVFDWLDDVFDRTPAMPAIQ